MSNLTIIMYHYVRDLKASRFPNIKGLDLELFIEQICYLKRYYHFVSSEDVVNSIESGARLPDKAVLLTFDDAYLDHYTNVFPILDKQKIQGSFYIPTKCVSRNTILDVNKIHYILAAQSDKHQAISLIKELLSIHRSEYCLDSFEDYFSKFASPSRYDSREVMFIKRLLQFGLEIEVREKIVDELFIRLVGMDQASFSRELYMSIEQVKTMSRNGMHIGCHGYNHFWWNKLSRNEMEAELDMSLKFLYEIGVDPNMWTACYPYGSYDDQAIEFLRVKGCKYALTTEVGIATTESDKRFLLPRLDTNDLPKSRNAEINNWYPIHYNAERN